MKAPPGVSSARKPRAPARRPDRLCEWSFGMQPGLGLTRGPRGTARGSRISGPVRLNARPQSPPHLCVSGVTPAFFPIQGFCGLWPL